MPCRGLSTPSPGFVWTRTTAARPAGGEGLHLERPESVFALQEKSSQGIGKGSGERGVMGPGLGKKGGGWWGW